MGLDWDEWVAFLVPVIASNVIAPLSADWIIIVVSVLVLLNAAYARISWSDSSAALGKAYGDVLISVCTAVSSAVLANVLRTTVPTLGSHLVYASVLAYLSQLLQARAPRVPLFKGAQSALGYALASLAASIAVLRRIGVHMREELLENEILIPPALSPPAALGALWGLALVLLPLLLVAQHVLQHESGADLAAGTLARGAALVLAPALWPLAKYPPGHIDLPFFCVLVFTAFLANENGPRWVLARELSVMLGQSLLAFRASQSDGELHVFAPLVALLGAGVLHRWTKWAPLSVATGVLKRFLQTQAVLLVLRRVPGVLALVVLGVAANLPQ